MKLYIVFTYIFLIVSVKFNEIINAQDDELINNNNDNDDDDDDDDNGDDNDDDDEYYIDNEIDMKPTYRSSVEKFLQGLTITLKTSKPIGLAGRVINGLPEPFRSLLLPRKNNSTKRQMELKNNNRGFGDILNIFSDDFKAIFPGTLWCGDGNVARNPDDIGVFSETDECCKQHDHCPFTIKAGYNRELLKNNGIFTRSACSCDYKFYNCLKKVNSLISENIGMTYFNILRPQCFGYHYPIESCEKYERARSTEKKCLQYKLDSTKNKTLEWYDLPDF